MNSFKDRKQKLTEQITAAKKKIDELKLKRAQEIGMLAIQSGLAEVDDNVLKTAFNDMAKSPCRNEAEEA